MEVIRENVWEGKEISCADIRMRTSEKFVKKQVMNLSLSRD